MVSSKVAVLPIAVVSAACLLLQFGCPASPQPPADTGVLGSGLDVNADPAETASAMLREIDAFVPPDETKIIGVVQPQTGPAGTVMGLALDNGTRLFALGSLASDGTATFTGAVLEDGVGNLILMQQNRDSASTVTLATGDAIDLDASGSGRWVTWTLNAA